MKTLFILGVILMSTGFILLTISKNNKREVDKKPKYRVDVTYTNGNNERLIFIGYVLAVREYNPRSKHYDPYELRDDSPYSVYNVRSYKIIDTIK